MKSTATAALSQAPLAFYATEYALRKRILPQYSTKEIRKVSQTDGIQGSSVTGVEKTTLENHCSSFFRIKENSVNGTNKVHKFGAEHSCEYSLIYAGDILEHLTKQSPLDIFELAGLQPTGSTQSDLLHLFRRIVVHHKKAPSDVLRSCAQEIMGYLRLKEVTNIQMDDIVCVIDAFAYLKILDEYWSCFLQAAEWVIEHEAELCRAHLAPVGYALIELYSNHTKTQKQVFQCLLSSILQRAKLFSTMYIERHDEINFNEHLLGNLTIKGGCTTLLHDDGISLDRKNHARHVPQKTSLLTVHEMAILSNAVHLLELSQYEMTFLNSCTQQLIRSLDYCSVIDLSCVLYSVVQASLTNSGTALVVHDQYAADIRSSLASCERRTYELSCNMDLPSLCFTLDAYSYVPVLSVDTCSSLCDRVLQLWTGRIPESSYSHSLPVSLIRLLTFFEFKTGFPTTKDLHISINTIKDATCMVASTFSSIEYRFENDHLYFLLYELLQYFENFDKTFWSSNEETVSMQRNPQSILFSLLDVVIRRLYKSLNSVISNPSMKKKYLSLLQSATTRKLCSRHFYKKC